MTRDREPPASVAAPVGEDLLAEVLKLARQEGVLEGEHFEAFLTGLRERAEKVIAERLGRAEAKAGLLETENQWQKDAMSTLTESLRSLEEEKAWLRETVGNLEAEAARRQGAIEEAGDEKRNASAAHDALRAHHQDLMARLAGQLDDVASLSRLRAQEVRRRLRALADQLRAETR